MLGLAGGVLVDGELEGVELEAVEAGGSLVGEVDELEEGAAMGVGVVEGLLAGEGLDGALGEEGEEEGALRGVVDPF